MNWDTLLCFLQHPPVMYLLSIQFKCMHSKCRFKFMLFLNEVYISSFRLACKDSWLWCLCYVNICLNLSCFPHSLSVSLHCMWAGFQEKASAVLCIIMTIICHSMMSTCIFVLICIKMLNVKMTEQKGRKWSTLWKTYIRCISSSSLVSFDREQWSRKGCEGNKEYIHNIFH